MQIRLQTILLSAVLLFSVTGAVSAQTVNVTDDISTNTTWTANNTYTLDGLIFVNDGANLTIEPGTVIKAIRAENITTGDDASALIVRRGGKLFAAGTPTQPIIFTSEDDDVNDPNDLTQRDRGLWGGIILLGRATNNEPNADTQIEGIPIEEEEAAYGGTDDADNSGTLRYVSIRHGGFSISGAEGDEINGLTFGSVGSGTIVEYVEVFANFDDCYEWFGGTVNTKYLVGAFCGDDGMDYDQGFRGKGQFWFVIQDDDTAGRAGEHDGGDSGGDTATPFSIPMISNATYIGSGNGATVLGGDNNDRAFAIRDNAGGMYYNSIFTDFAGVALNIEDIDGDDGDSRGRFEAGDLAFVNNLWFGFGAGTDLASIIDGDWAETQLAADGNTLEDPQIAGISRTNDGGLDPRPLPGSPALSGYMDTGDDFFTDVNFRGAFGGNLWINGWTALYDVGYSGSLLPEVTVTADISTDETWTANNTYILDGLIFVNDGATLTIEPGTVVKALRAENITTGDDASALIIRRGGKIEVSGTANNPIIFTSEDDDVDDPNDLTQRDRGLWGGIILLGRATNNEPNADTQIEGIPVEEEEASYGGTDDADNSGTMRYVSIRHGGFSISGAEGDEINGLTFGSVGSGTTIEYVEVYANFDDCYEWFGGTVTTKYLVGAFCGDDGMDYDQGFRGKGQFWFVIQDDDTAGRAGEHDGGDSGGDTAEPFSIPMISNATYIGSGNGATVLGGDNNDRAFAIRDNAGGMYYNSIFTDFAGVALNIEDIDGDDGDSRGRFEAGDLAFRNNIWFGFGAGTDLADIIDGDFAEAQLVTDGNTLEDPQIAGISRTDDGGLDPRPVAGSVALTGAIDTGDDFFMDVAFRGAFGEENWLLGWTALDMTGFVGSVSNVAVEPVDDVIPGTYALEQNYPNPFNPSTTIEFAIDQTQFVKLAVFDILGREVSTLVNESIPAGNYEVNFDASGLPSGVYLYRLNLSNSVTTRMMTLTK